MGYYAHATGSFNIYDEEGAIEALRNVEDCPEQPTAIDVLVALGFEFFEDNIYFDVKLRDQIRFLEALAPYADFEIDWRGEDGHLWRTRTVNGGYHEDAGQIIYADDMPY